jgi:hypothetical protein
MEAKTCVFCREVVADTIPRILLAMQKVEGSNPFSRFPERPAFAGLSVPASGGAFASTGSNA